MAAPEAAPEAFAQKQTFQRRTAKGICSETLAAVFFYERASTRTTRNKVEIRGICGHILLGSFS